MPVPNVNALCFALNVAYSVLLNKPAVVPVTDANGTVKAIAGVVVALITVDVNVLPLAVTVIGFTFVTVPPVPVAVIVIDPFPLMIDTPEPAVKVDFVSVLPVVFPINNSPFKNEDSPVPPFTTATTPVNCPLLIELPLISFLTN